MNAISFVIARPIDFPMIEASMLQCFKSSMLGAYDKLNSAVSLVGWTDRIHCDTKDGILPFFVSGLGAISSNVRVYIGLLSNPRIAILVLQKCMGMLSVGHVTSKFHTPRMDRQKMVCFWDCNQATIRIQLKGNWKMENGICRTALFSPRSLTKNPMITTL